MNKSETLNEIAAALSAAQGEMPAVKFNSTNPFLKNKYADLGAIIEAAKPVLARHGLSVSQMVCDAPGGIGVETVIMHKSGQWFSSTVAMPLGEEKGKSQAQVAGSIITYLRRYALAAALGMYADEDGDGNQPAPRQAQPAQAAAPVMTYEQAAAITNREGVAYSEIDTETLANIANNAKAPAEKRAAAATIITHRLKG